MIDDNSKKLGRVFMIVLIVIGIIIMLYLEQHHVYIAIINQYVDLIQNGKKIIINMNYLQLLL